MPIRVPVDIDDSGAVVHEQLWNVAELADFLGMSQRTVRRRVNTGLWPYVRRGDGRLMFTREHVRMIVSVVNESHDYPAHEPANRRDEI